MESEKNYTEQGNGMDHASSKDQGTIEDVQVGGKELAACQIELASWKEKYLRSTADFQNFSKRMEKEQAEWMRIAQTNVLKDVLPLIDDIERALADLKTKEHNVEVVPVVTALTMIMTAATKMLTKYNVKEITQTTTFNPDLHEALMSVASPDHASGAIVAVLQKGYTVNDQVLRPAKVSVAQ
ncbi:MAG TPA: nucleotide exchange factor GrpE [Candidatus Limnocylindria bacterium]|nr:nucleotide exchange factor GrpE [Candidatus Limnocylindria bacterium]